jgi:hypothetical protein
MLTSVVYYMRVLIVEKVLLAIERSKQTAEN